MFIVLGAILCALHILSNLTFTIIFILHFFFLIYSILQVSKLRQKEVTCPRSQSKEVVELRSETWHVGSKSIYKYTYILKFIYSEPVIINYLIN